MRRLLARLWHYADKPEYGVNGAIKTAVFGERKRQSLDLKKSLHLFDFGNRERILDADLYPYFHTKAGFTLQSFDFWRHSLLLGASGSGKSKLSANFIRQISEKSELKNKYHLLVIDPHANLQNDIGGLANAEIFDFENNSLDLFGLENNLMAVEMLVSLFENLMAEQYNPKLERVLRNTVSLLLSVNDFSFDNFKRVLLEVAYRNELLSGRTDIPTATRDFFLTGFTEMKTRYYNESVAPLIAFLDEMEQLEMRGISTKLQDAINNNFLNIVSLNCAEIGERMTKVVSNLIFEQIYLLAVARKIENLIVVVDEVAMVESPILAKMLSELRKFGVTIILCEQYLTQVSVETKNAILANVVNYFSFRVSADDAEFLESTLLMKCLEDDSPEERQKILMKLADRECVARIMNNGKVMAGFLAKTADFSPTPFVPPTRTNEVMRSDRQETTLRSLEIGNVNLRKIMVKNSTARKPMR